MRLGSLSEGGLAPAILAIVERGVTRRPVLASGVRAEVQLDFDEGYPPVRVAFAGQHVLVEDGHATTAISGSPAHFRTCSA